MLVALLVGTGLGINAPLWSRNGSFPSRYAGLDGAREAIRCNIWLAALVYAWGASALFGVYSLSDLTLGAMHSSTAPERPFLQHLSVCTDCGSAGSGPYLFRPFCSPSSTASPSPAD